MSILEAVRNTSPDQTTFGSERRMHHRVHMRVPASVRLGGGPWLDAGLTRDLSAGGALIELSTTPGGEYGEGDPIQFEVRLPAAEGVWPGPSVATAEAVVQRSIESGSLDDRSDGLSLIALRFVERLRFRF